MDLLFAFKQWYGMHQHLPKLFRITISTKMLEALSECMELCVMINFSRKTEKEKEELNTRLLELRGKIELLKAYALVSWEMKFISHGFYGQYSERLENISKQAASWHAWFVKR
ncbi:MAG: four helix bundle protein [Bacteroidetes bacterium]|nr:MAG: four helix bundle protein [Bacteroidota bacterium]